MAIDIDKIRQKLKKQPTKEIIIDLVIEFKLMNGRVLSNSTSISRLWKIAIPITTGIMLAIILYGLKTTGII